MPCYLLHMVEEPDRHAWDDPDLKDLVGEVPRLFCVQCTPPSPLRPSESVRCMAVDGPCWKPEHARCAPAHREL